ncbi:HVA22-like protein a [Hibiscus syriacus]|uniref:HVA22-like protein a n=1 Tax=Hibiscus syriacus TaxID=106335 RepID=UPI001924D1A1|nr:HVA22-like protein a [Hibiscus syriacus]
MGSGTASFLKVLLKNFYALAGPLRSCLDLNWVNCSLLLNSQTSYASVRAIESESRADDREWLTYWVLYSMLTLLELSFARVIEWIPIWSFAKLIFTCWLVIPYFSGASYVYEHYLRPFFINPQQTINIWYVPRKDFFSKPDDISTAAERYIEENGTEAFEKLVHRADKSRSSAYRY